MPQRSTVPHPTYTTPPYHNHHQIASHCHALTFRRRFNLKKANWSKITNEIDQAIANIPAHPSHYNDFVDIMKKAARHNIHRGCQKEYIPDLSDESSELPKLYDEEYNKDPFSEFIIIIIIIIIKHLLRAIHPG